jgi:multiple sugar transport system permease protein
VMALLANRKVPAQWLFRLVFFAPYVLPVAIVYLVWNWLYQPDYGLINSFLAALGIGSISWLSSPTAAMPAVVITTVWWTIGFNFILYLAGLQEIPQELYEAAAIDGASGWARLRYITIPLLQRTTTLIVILQVLASLKVFDQIYLLTGGGPDGATRSIIEYIYEQGFQSYRLGYAAAMSYVFFVLILVISVAQFVLFSRRKEGV